MQPLLNSGINGSARPSIFSNLLVWWRNPIFYLSILVALFSLFCVILHSIWGFAVGISISLICVGVPIWIACAIVDHYRQPPRQVSSWQKLKTGFFVVFIIGIYIAGIYIQIVQLSIFFGAGSADPDWQAFPEKCKVVEATKPHILNCVRVGTGIPNPNPSIVGPITVPAYKTSMDSAVAVFKNIMKQRADFPNCLLINEVSNAKAGWHFLHFRCLSSFAGYPDDVAVRLACSHDGTVAAWFHSESRLLKALWDHNLNDARIRLMLAYSELPTTWWPFSTDLQNSKCHPPLKQIQE